MMAIHCPKCNSDEIEAEVLASGFAYVDLKTGELTDDPEDCNYDSNDIDEFICRNCEYKWQGKLPEDIWKIWAENREKQAKKIKEKSKMLGWEVNTYANQKES